MSARSPAADRQRPTPWDLLVVVLVVAAAVALLFAFLLFCVGALVRYARPMNDASYDLSLA